MRDYLTTKDWFELGLSTLAAKGISAVRAGPMAAALGVSRGSFYWHFESVEVFRKGMLEHWRMNMTQQVIVDLASEDQTDQLRLLFERAFGSKPKLEQAIRAWGSQDAVAAASVMQVDSERVKFIAQLLKAAGLDEKRAAARARFIYWAYIGHVSTLNEEGAAIDGQLLAGIAELMKQG